jgi:hypothetical protein
MYDVPSSAAFLQNYWTLSWSCSQIPLVFCFNSSGPNDYWYDETIHSPHSLNFYTEIFDVLISFLPPVVFYIPIRWYCYVYE